MSEKRIREILRAFYNKLKAIQGFFSKWKGTIKGLIFFVVLVAVIAIISIYFSIVLTAEALKTLVQAEATFFGFFGVIFVYVLKQYDDKLEDWKETANNLTPCESTEAISELSTTEGEQIINIINEVRENKKDFVDTSIAIGTFITISMLMSIWLIGSFEIPNAYLNNPLVGVFLSFGYFAIALFLLAIYVFLQQFRKMGEET